MTTPQQPRDTERPRPAAIRLVLVLAIERPEPRGPVSTQHPGVRQCGVVEATGFEATSRRAG